MGYGPSPATGEHNYKADIDAIFVQIWADMQEAGTGTAQMRIGPRAERVAYGTPYDGLYWVETDYPAAWKYVVALTDWIRLGWPDDQIALLAQVFGR